MKKEDNPHRTTPFNEFYVTLGRIRTPLEKQRDFAGAQPADLVRILPVSLK